MSQITRTDFTNSLCAQKISFDLDKVGQELQAAGLSLTDLRRVAGEDGMIAGRAEYQKLFALMDRLDHDGSAQSLAFEDKHGTLTASGNALAVLATDILDQRLAAQVGGNPKLQATTAVGGPAGTGKSAPWLDVVKGELGVKEEKGSGHNARVLEYHASTRLKATDDETPWCSSFVNWAMEKAGLSGTDSAQALSWLRWGKDLAQPAVGSIAVIDWGNGKGHVGFVVGESGGRIVVAGGNQGNQVKYSTYDRDQIKSFRVPTDYSVPPGDYQLPKMNVRHLNQSLGSTR